MRLDRQVQSRHVARNLAVSRSKRDDRDRRINRVIRRALAAGLAWLTMAMSFGAAARQPGEERTHYAPSDADAAVAANDVSQMAVGFATELEGVAPSVAEVADTDGVCGEGMVLVEGSYCTDVQHRCKRWLDDEKLPFARCGDYEENPRCVGERVKMRFCIDRYEHTAEGESLPANHASFNQASATCRELGKRVCTESEWNFACEGEEMRPYPYGFSRQAVCNQDHEKLYEDNPHMQVLADLREPANARPECVSPFGVYNMVGNMDEPVLREAAKDNPPFRNALKGGWWMPARNRCRPATTAHDDNYRGIQVGVRCCSNASGGAASPSG
jgi:Sulfatase-modifying factor enzyme 1